jgi:sulfur carrier protein
MITLQVNGKEVELDAPIPLVLYLEKLGVNPRTVAVEHNGEIIQRTSFAAVVLQEGDRVEIVRMVGGGIHAGGAQGAAPARRRAAP